MARRIRKIIVFLRVAISSYVKGLPFQRAPVPELEECVDLALFPSVEQLRHPS